MSVHPPLLPTSLRNSAKFQQSAADDRCHTMANQPLPPTSTNTTPTPPLLALPVELKLHILSYLSVKKPFVSHQQDILSLIILRRTHRSFREIIPHAPYASECQTLRWFQLHAAEKNHPYPIPPNHYPCYRCFRLIESSGFDKYGTPAIGHVLRAFLESNYPDRRCNRCWDRYQQVQRRMMKSMLIYGGIHEV